MTDSLQGWGRPRRGRAGGEIPRGRRDARLEKERENALADHGNGPASNEAGLSGPPADLALQQAAKGQGEALQAPRVGEQAVEEAFAQALEDQFAALARDVEIRANGLDPMLTVDDPRLLGGLARREDGVDAGPKRAAVDVERPLFDRLGLMDQLAGGDEPRPFGARDPVFVDLGDHRVGKGPTLGRVVLQIKTEPVGHEGPDAPGAQGVVPVAEALGQLRDVDVSKRVHHCAQAVVGLRVHDPTGLV